MTASADFKAPVAEQMLLRGLLRGFLRLFFRGLVRPPMPVPAPAALVCFSPVTDLTGEQMHEPPAGDPLLHPSWIEQAAQLYCPADLLRNDPGMSPLFADLSQLPPTLIQVGEDELLLNDSLRLAERAKAAGVNLRLERYPGLWHVFQAHVGMLCAADYAIARVAAFLRERGV